MIRFLIKGLLRDRSRSLFPTLTVVAGTALTVVMYSWIRGTEADIIRANANFNTGHVRVMTRAYTAEVDRTPNDLAVLGADELVGELEQRFPDFAWVSRIRFGGLLDIPDATGETRAQAPVTGLAVQLLDEDSIEREVLNLDNALVRGKLPTTPGEIVVSVAADGYRPADGPGAKLVAGEESAVTVKLEPLEESPDPPEGDS